MTSSVKSFLSAVYLPARCAGTSFLGTALGRVREECSNVPPVRPY